MAVVPAGAARRASLPILPDYTLREMNALSEITPRATLTLARPRAFLDTRTGTGER
jgi:hypothetical protein